MNDEAILTDIQTTREICRFKGVSLTLCVYAFADHVLQDGTAITALAVTPSGSHLTVVYSSLFLRIYELPVSAEDPSSSQVPWVRQVVRAHDTPVHVMAVDRTSSFLASGSADGHVKVWDIRRGYVTHHYSGLGGVISALAFHFEQSDDKDQKKATKLDASAKYKTMRLICASVDSKIRIFDMLTSRSDPISTLDGHVSVPRSLSVSDDGRRLVSSGRDSVILVWDLEKPTSEGKSAKKQKLTFRLLATIPVLERVEAAGIICSEPEDEGGFKVFTAGEKGVVSIWDVRKGKLVRTMGEENSADLEEQRQIVHAVSVVQ